MNKLISIGCLADKHCYLNISKEEAVKRYLKDEDLCISEPWVLGVLESIEEFEFEDEFWAYEIGVK